MTKLLLFSVLYRYDAVAYDGSGLWDWFAAGAYAAYMTIARW